MRKQIKLMPDYYCHPLWLLGEEFDNLDPTSLSLTPTTIARLQAWAEKYDAILNEEYPPDSRFESYEDELIFELEGIALWLKLRQELSPKYEVIYYSCLTRQVIVQPTEMVIWHSPTVLFSKQSDLVLA